MSELVLAQKFAVQLTPPTGYLRADAFHTVKPRTYWTFDALEPTHLVSMHDWGASYSLSTT